MGFESPASMWGWFGNFRSFAYPFAHSQLGVGPIGGLAKFFLRDTLLDQPLSL